MCWWQLFLGLCMLFTALLAIPKGQLSIHKQAIDDATGPALWVVSEADAVLEAQQLQPGRQVYEGRVTQGVVRLEPGDVVVDVGANVGSFARYAAQQVGPTGRVLAVEPIPLVVEALKLNAHLHATWAAAAGIPAAPIECIACGLVAVAPELSGGTAEFVFYPRCAALSTLSTTRDDKDALSCTFSLMSHDTAPPVSALQRVARAAARALPPAIFRPLYGTIFSRLYLGGARSVTCRVVTLSQLLREHSVERVGLLKINVERGELGVLRGVEPQDWAKIRQVSMQVHDIPLPACSSEASGAPTAPAGSEHDDAHGASGSHPDAPISNAPGATADQHPAAAESSSSRDDGTAGHRNQTGAAGSVCSKGVAEAVRLLTEVGGFEVVTTYKEPRFAGCSLWQVYASRGKVDVAPAGST